MYSNNTRCDLRKSLSLSLVLSLSLSLSTSAWLSTTRINQMFVRDSGMYSKHEIFFIKVLSMKKLYKIIIIPPANFVCRGYTVFTLSVCASVRPCVRPSVRPSVTLCFLNNSKSHCWIFIKPCKHVHICKTNTLDKKVRARGQFY